MNRVFALLFTIAFWNLVSSGYAGSTGVLFKSPAPFSTSMEVTEFKEIFLLSSTTGEVLQKDGKRVTFQFPLVQLIIFNDDSFLEAVKENSQINLFNGEIREKEIALRSFPQCFDETHTKAIESKLEGDNLWISRVKGAKPYLQAEVDSLSKDLGEYKAGQRKVNGEWLSLFQYAKQSWLSDPMFNDLLTEDDLSLLKTKVKTIDEQISIQESSKKQFEETRLLLGQQIERYEKGERRKNGEWVHLKDLQDAVALKEFAEIESKLYETNDLSKATALINRAQTVTAALPEQNARAKAWEQEIYSVEVKLKDFDVLVKETANDEQLVAWLYPSDMNSVKGNSKKALQWVDGLSKTLEEIPTPQVKALREKISSKKSLIKHFASLESLNELMVQNEFNKCREIIISERETIKIIPESSVSILLLKSLDSHVNVIDVRLAEFKQKMSNAEQLKKMGKMAASIKELEAAFSLYPDPKIPEMIKNLREDSLGL